MNSILIGGPARSGKSVLGRTIAAVTGHPIIEADTARLDFWHIEDMAEREAERERRYVALLSESPCGLILEGDDLTARNIGDSQLVMEGAIQEDPTLSLKLPMLLMSRFNARAYLVGCADADVAEKTAAIRKYQERESFTVGFSDSELANYVAFIVMRSAALRQLARENGVPYFEIGTATYQEDIERAAEVVIGHTKREGYAVLRRSCSGATAGPALARRSPWSLPRA